MPRPTIVVLTTAGSQYGIRLLNLLNRQHTPPAAVIVRRNTFRRKWRLLQSVARRIGWIDAGRAAISEVFTDLRMPVGERWKAQAPLQHYNELAGEVRLVGTFADQEVLRDLEDLHPDYLILAQSGMIKDGVIAAARQGVLNAHPGLLPQYRGVDVPWWTLHDGKPELLASTLHFVDAGVDTGPIVTVRPFVCPPGLRFEDLTWTMYEDCLDLLAEAVHDLEEGRTLHQRAQATDQGRQCYKMPTAAKRIARTTFERWQHSQHREP